ncbi:RNA-binding 34 [Pelobates cultripes]|uniref:RNA-binding 34 n=1 Tax=Pelobates cultripes TaxID=61616 RepID=A0AAD1R9L3_PELCU|nr:RNA-binding 34 [Pelobates cultripes]
MGKKSQVKSGNSGETQSKDSKPSESYVAGDIAESLFAKKSCEKDSSLLSLFNAKTCTVQAAYVPVAATPVKRKLPEEDVSKKSTPSVVNVSPAKKSRVLSEGEQKVADRESALSNADIDEKVQKKTLKVAKKGADVETAVTRRIRKKINKREEAAKNKRTVFVGNLPVDYTKPALMKFFKEFGLIESVRFRSLTPAEPKLSKKAATIQRKSHPKRNNINAYVVFKEESSAAKALKRNGAEVVSGVCIRVDLASANKSHDNKKSAFVGNLPYEIQEDSVREHFAECGKVEAVRLIRDKTSGLGKGFGYVLFDCKDAVQLAMKLNNSELMGRKLRVKRCITESSGKAPPKKLKRSFDSSKKTKPQDSKAFVGEIADVKKNIKKNKIKKKTGPKMPKGTKKQKK